MDVDLIAALHSQGLLSEERRIAFVLKVRTAATENADDSFLASEKICDMLTNNERDEILNEVASSVLGQIEQHVERVHQQWDNDYDPSDHFDELKSSIHLIAKALSSRVDVDSILAKTDKEIRSAISKLENDYEPPTSSPLPPEQSAAKSSSLVDLFRDVDE